MTATLLPNAKQTFLDGNGKPLAGGQVFFYIPNTSTFKSTWQDPAQTILNTNPVILDASGEAIIWGSGTYRQVVYDVNGNLIWDQITEDTSAGLIGNFVDDIFVAGDGTGNTFIPGTTSALTLTNDPGTLPNTWIYFDSAYQADNQIASLNFPILTFVDPIPVGVQTVTVKSGSSIPVGTPSAGSVTDNTVAANANIDSNKLSFLQAGSGALRRTVQSKLRDWVSVKDFGAIGDGTTDDTNAFVLALATGRSVFVPDGTYSIKEGQLMMSTAGQTLEGTGQNSFGQTTAGAGAVLIGSTNAGSPLVSISNAWVRIANLTMTRSATPGSIVAGGNGIQFTGDCNYCVLENLFVDNQYIGVGLSNTIYGTVEKIVCQRCTNSGLQMSSKTGTAALQWQMENVLVQNCGATGILVIGDNSAGCPQATMGTWHNVNTFANTGFGVGFTGSAGCPIHDIRVSDSFFGQDANDEVLLDTHGSQHQFVGVFTELAGTANTGPSNGTPPSHIGNGFNFTANNVDTILSGCRGTGHTNNGLLINGGAIHNITGCQFLSNGGDGIVFTGGTQITLNGNACIGNVAFGVANGGSIDVMVGNNIKPNTAGTFTGTAPGIGGATLNNQ